MFTPTAGAVVADRYVLVREIGRGGMGSVWQAQDRQLEAPCALKFILDTFAAHPELRTRFIREARAVAGLQSPHLVSIRGVGEFESSLFIAMELLEGETLQQRLEREGRLSESATLALVDQVASVLTKAHAAGIVHRDLKPDNVWLWADEPLFIKLLDFGVAKHVLESANILKTATGALVGTPHYMSPEQAEGTDVDHRTDVWALGILAIECLTGKRPFEGNTIAELLLKVARLPVPPLRDLDPAFSGLEEFWSKASARPREERFQTARQLAEALRKDVERMRTKPPVFDVTEKAPRIALPITASPVSSTVNDVNPERPWAKARGSHGAVTVNKSRTPTWVLALGATGILLATTTLGFVFWRQANPTELTQSAASGSEQSALPSPMLSSPAERQVPPGPDSPELAPSNAASTLSSASAAVSVPATSSSLPHDSNNLQPPPGRNQPNMPPPAAQPQRPAQPQRSDTPARPGQNPPGQPRPADVRPALPSRPRPAVDPRLGF